MKKFILAIFILVSGCATQSARVSPDFKAYAENLSYTVQKTRMTHNEYGEKLMNEEPLLSIHKKCIKASFEGFSVTFGEVIVKEPLKLDAMTGDYTVYNFMKSLGLNRGKARDSEQANHRRVMTSIEFKEAINTLEVPDSNARKCLLDKGWEFVRPKNN